MDITNAQRAKILVEALPYIQNYTGKIIVIKYGGNAMVSEELKNQVMEDIVLLSLVGVKVVLVHGGGPEITDLLSKIGKKSEFVDGLRVTDKETADVVQMVLAGKVNKSLVNLIGVKGGSAMGNSGIDDHLIPVISTVACDREVNVYNINADTAAAYIAGAMRAESLITMTDIAGILRDRDDPSSLIPCIDLAEADQLFCDKVISGGMIPKVECCIEAIHRGVRKVVIMDGRVPHAILIETLTDEGAGTMVVEDKNNGHF